MKKARASLCLLLSALLVTPALAARPKIDKKIFAGRFRPADISLASSSGDSVIYSAVRLRMSKRGKLKGSALRFDSISGESVAVTIAGTIKGRPKLRGKGNERYALAKGTVRFSDGAICEGQFASRKFKNGKRFRALSPQFQLGLFLQIFLNLLGQTFNGTMFIGVR